MHPIYLNIKMVLKPPSERQKASDITKVAIGKPGGVDMEQDKYN